jgi:hypothetical protein
MHKILIAVVLFAGFTYSLTQSHATNTVPVINGITPGSGSVGTLVTLTGSFSNPNTVLFGSGALVNVIANNGTLTFTVPGVLNPLCSYSRPPCKIPSKPTATGTYPVSVMDKNGTSNTVNFDVTN